MPVGEDQRQHLELTRDIAERFNRFGHTFVVPEAYIPKVGGRVMDLQVPTAEMSKSSASLAGRIELLDPPDVIRRKVRSAVTDSGRRCWPAGQAGHLQPAGAVLGGHRHHGRGAGAGLRRPGYGDFKADLADALIAFLTPVRERYHELRGDPARLQAILEQGAAKAQAIARENLTLAKDRMGFLPRRAGG